MNTRGCALVILLVLVIVLAYGLLSSNMKINIAIPTLAIPTFGNIGTLPPVATGPVIPTLRHSSATQTALAPPKPTPLPGPVNGRLVFLGFDQAVWSVNPDGSNPVSLGYFSDFNVNSPSRWTSPDGRYALVTRRENEQQIAFLVSVDGSQAYRIAPVSPEFDFGAPRDVFGFSPDGKRFFFLDAATNPANLIVFDLPGGSNFTWPVQASVEELTFAAFAGNDHILLKSYDPAINGHYLDLFDIPSMANPRRVVELPDHKIIQFAVAPGGQWAAVVFRAQQPGVNPDRLYVVNLESKEMRPIVDQAGASVLLIDPAWSLHGQYLMVNLWTPGTPYLYNLISYDVQANKAVKIIGDFPSNASGQPLARVASFSPDGGLAGIYLYDEKQDSIAFVRAILDGTQTLRIADASLVDRLPVGEFVSAVARDWTHMLVVSPQGGLPTGELYSTWMDGNGRTLIDSPVPYRFFELGPVISPDGKRAAYLRIDLGTQQAELVTNSLDAKDRRVLFAGTATQGDQPPVGLPLAWLSQP